MKPLTLLISKLVSAGALLAMTSMPAAAAGADGCPIPVTQYAISPECIASVYVAREAPVAIEASFQRLAPDGGPVCPTPVTQYAVSLECIRTMNER